MHGMRYKVAAMKKVWNCASQREQRERSFDDQLAFEAGKNLKSLPCEALGHVNAIKAYGEGLDECEMKAHPHPSISPDPLVMEKIEQCRYQQREAMRKAIAIRDAACGEDLEVLTCIIAAMNPLIYTKPE